MFLMTKRDKLLDCIQNMFMFDTFDTVQYINNFNKNKFKFTKLACFDLDYTFIYLSISFL